MKTKHLIIIIAQSLMIVVLAGYAFVQQTVAKEAEQKTISAMENALAYKANAEAAKAEADRQRMQAEAAMAEAQRQEVLAFALMQKVRIKN